MATASDLGAGWRGSAWRPMHPPSHLPHHRFRYADSLLLERIWSGHLLRAPRRVCDECWVGPQVDCKLVVVPPVE
ncbi:hypothetical protein ZWY2020_058267 [Hordeum vulgare]|nr:hypothetical protein ZWY2020_058267 [Hordeum vulgare]